VCRSSATIPRLGQAVAEPPEGLFDAMPVEYGHRFAHAASIS
jgi:hypothetical protein